MEILVNKSTNSVTLGTAFLTTKLDLSSMDPLVESVVWDTVTEKGTKFFGAEAMVNGYLRPQEQIFGEEYRRLVGPIVDLAMDHWEARKNPLPSYRISEGDGFVGQEVLITTYPHPTTAPAGFTLQVPPVVSDQEDPLLQWTGTGWYRAPWSYQDDINIQKEDFKNHILTQISEKVNNQLRVYSMYDIIENGKSLRPADSKKHGHLTMESYINELKNRYQLVLELINSAIKVDDLFQLNFDVNDLF